MVFFQYSKCWKYMGNRYTKIGSKDHMHSLETKEYNGGCMVSVAGPYNQLPSFE